jgi:superfamily I DNA/RNA helicase/DNA polymerase III epsilon subunit-like protein
MNLVFDTETTGLFKKGVSYKKLNEFDGSRLVSISWLLTKGDNIVDQSYFIIKPDNWEISAESTAIHGITKEYAMEKGDNIKMVLEGFYNSIKRCKNIIAHNIEFDEAIIKSELFRYGYTNVIEEMDKKHKICTMVKGRFFMNVRKFPKLSELYKFLYKEELTNAHCALDDTKNCFKCYIKLFPSDKNIFYFGDKEIKLSEEQQKIVFEKLDKNMLILAGAGSGKTCTLITRIKFLLDNGVSEDSIVLTTFTRNAASDMREKLFDIMGYRTDITVGTIDSIAKSYVELYSKKVIESVEEYTPEFLKILKEKPSLLKNFKYLFVDEVQDINEDQFNIIMEFYKVGVYIIGIGDDSQNIYEFRGSNIEYILNFTKYFKNCNEYKLVLNFRSTQEIVNLANACIEKNKNRIPKNMISIDPNLVNLKPNIICFSNQEKQNEYVLECVKDLIDKGVTEDSICIMSSLNKPLLDINILLDNNNIKNYYSSNNDDTRIVKNGCINLNTIHKSKGLEWEYIFLINMNDEQNKRNEKYNRDDPMKIQKLLEANRRLLYVAITRAKKELNIFSDCNEISRFLSKSEIDNKLFNKLMK